MLQRHPTWQSNQQTARKVDFTNPICLHLTSDAQKTSGDWKSVLGTSVLAVTWVQPPSPVYRNHIRSDDSHSLPSLCLLPPISTPLTTSSLFFLWGSVREHIQVFVLALPLRDMPSPCQSCQAWCIHESTQDVIDGDWRFYSAQAS